MAGADGKKISDAPLIVLDGAHNPQGINSLIATLRRVFGSQPLTLMVGILGDKDVAGMVAALAKTPYRLWFVPVPDNPRALAWRIIRTCRTARGLPAGRQPWPRT